MTLIPRTPRPAVAARPLIWNRPRLRFIEGAADGEGGSIPPATPPAGAPAPIPQPPAPAAPAAAAKPEPKGDTVDPYIKQLREENAERRIAAKQAADAKEAAEKHAADLEAQLKQLQVDAAVRTIAAKPDINGNASALLDSRALTNKLKSVDPTDTAAVEAAVKEVLEARPDLKNSPKVPGSSGSATHTGGHTTKAPNLQQSIAQQIEAQLTPKGN
ncbi:hypothetical protein F8O06_02760 [Pseudoclavibacter sp. CFCC 14310]|uniref:hypothetical protein n=1 Tax=Pseudoclavibacter sp. CFCC 14310 TaxID=2615180 RepID=UPI001300D176|nr:hypothetical protein [Pseudoclavibacter sp. CFCC 14310]KAB1647478.1 hypothetical protein F8O06_02760 [Pseudoclavibacter sp. CFCC 14310]